MKKMILMLVFIVFTITAQADEVTLTGVITDSLDKNDEICGTTAVELGKIRFTPINGFSGDCKFIYEIEDEGGLTDTATVTVQVKKAPPPPPENNVPTCEDFTVDTVYVHTFTADLTPYIHDDDIGDTLTGNYEGSGVSSGDIVIDNANTDVSGTDATITVVLDNGSGDGYIDYTVTDGTDTSALCRVTFTNLLGML